MTPLMNIGVHVAARSIAKRAVVQELREQGVRVTLVRPAEINEKATVYIATHPEIWPLAVERARRMEEMEEARKAARRAIRSRRAIIAKGSSS
jgi:NAD(P)-dependent dehydrogenase (short-subunit alcohol dehydrogenase family)